jgi:hypothetical protein
VSFRSIFIAALVSLAASARANALELSIEVERFSHYIPTVTRYTVPPSYLAVGKVSMTFLHRVVLGISGGTSFAGAGSKEVGASAEYIMGMKGRLEVRIYSAAMYYAMDPPTTPVFYQIEGPQLRIGFNAVYRLGPSMTNGPFLSLTAPATRFSNGTYNIAPALGFGIRY